MYTPLDRTYSVLVSHRDPVLRLGLTATLKRSRHADEVFSCETADSSYEQWLRAARVVVVDHPQALELCGRRERPGPSGLPGTLNIMVVAVQAGEQEIRSAISAGVRGYLLSGFELEEFIAGVEAVGVGTRYLCSGAARRLVDSMSREELTLRERQVLRCLLNGYVNKRICDELGIALGTVKSHVKAIFSKFGVVTRTQAVSMATQLGLAQDLSDLESELPGYSGTASARRAFASGQSDEGI